VPIVRIELAELLLVIDTGFTLKLELVRCGKPLRLRLTLPVNPLEGVTVMVSLELELTATLMVPEAAPSENVPDGLVEFTTSVTVVEWVKLPLVPVIVKVYVPAGVVLAVVMAIVDDPEAVTELGVNVAVAPEGRPEALKPTVPLNPVE